MPVKLPSAEVAAFVPAVAVVPAVALAVFVAFPVVFFNGIVKLSRVSFAGALQSSIKPQIVADTFCRSAEDAFAFAFVAAASVASTSDVVDADVAVVVVWAEAGCSSDNFGAKIRTRTRRMSGSCIAQSEQDPARPNRPAYSINSYRY